MMPSNEIRQNRVNNLITLLIEGATVAQLAAAMNVDKSEVGRYINRLRDRTGIKILHEFIGRASFYTLETPIEEARKLTIVKGNGTGKDRKAQDALVYVETKEANNSKFITPPPASGGEQMWWALIDRKAPIENTSRRAT